MWISLALRMAVRALEDRVIRRIGVTGGTHSTGSSMIGWKPRVIERCPGPGRGGVARLARGRESRRRVVRICRALVFGGMTGVAVSRRPREDVVDVALAALDIHMGAGQGERRLAVIEHGARP